MHSPSLTEETILSLSQRAQQIRLSALKMIFSAQSGHPGGSFSAAEILSTLFFYQLNIDPSNPQWPDRDRFILSKGHAAPALYAALAQRGFFPEAELASFRQIDSKLQGHPDMNKTPGVDLSTGSLGQGLAAGVGMALAAQLHEKDYHTWVLLGDGELDEGEVWEAAAYASFRNLANLTAVVDWNGVQLDGPTREIVSLDPLPDKWKAFGWAVYECDGHSVTELLDRYNKAVTDDRPSVILAHTVKGKGVSFMEGQAAWHGAAPNYEQYSLAVAELEAALRGESR